MEGDIYKQLSNSLGIADYYPPSKKNQEFKFNKDLINNGYILKEDVSFINNKIREI
jgi:hypothetical protein